MNVGRIKKGCKAYRVSKNACKKCPFWEHPVLYCKRDACHEKQNHKHDDGCLPTAGCTGVREAYDLAAASGVGGE